MRITISESQDSNDNHHRHKNKKRTKQPMSVHFRPPSFPMNLFTLPAIIVQKDANSSTTRPAVRMKMAIRNGKIFEGDWFVQKNTFNFA
jgi:hypothetical protein